MGKNGSLRLLESVAGQTSGGPIDMALSRDSHFLYAMNSRADSISAYRIDTRGGLEKIDFEAGLPASAVSLAAR